MSWNEKEIQNENYWNQKYVEKLEKNLLKFKEDPQKKVRLQMRECKVCFYLKGGIAGQAFTEYKCRNCESLEMHHNTNTPRLCNKCSDELSICVKCGGSL